MLGVCIYIIKDTSNSIVVLNVDVDVYGDTSISRRMCPYSTSVPTSQVSLQHKCPYITSVPTSQVSLHHKCPYITSVSTSPYITSVPSPHAVTGEDTHVLAWPSLA